MQQQRPILTLTLNPALDMSTQVTEVVPDRKLRCADPTLDPGGGGLNVSRAIANLGGDSLALVALGGITGERLARLIRSAKVPFLTVGGPGETRQSLTVTEAGGRQFRFIFPGPSWGHEDQERLFHLLRSAVQPDGIAVISGSQPPGVAPDFPAQLAAALPGMQVVLDSSGPALAEAVAHPIPGLSLLRMDDHEADELAGRRLLTPTETADFAMKLITRGVAKTVIIARGAEGSILATTGQRLFVKAADVPVKSKVGAGDSFVAGYVLALARGQDVAAALQAGSSAASAAVMTEATQLCRRADAEALLPLCPVTPI